MAFRDLKDCLQQCCKLSLVLTGSLSTDAYRVCILSCLILNMAFSWQQAATDEDVIFVATPGVREVYAKTHALISKRFRRSRTDNTGEMASTNIMMVNPRNDESW